MRQSFSHGRSKQVVVEKVKRRSSAAPRRPRPNPAAVAGAQEARRGDKQRPPPRRRRPLADAPKPSGVVLRTLTDEERSARAHALADAACAKPKSARSPRRMPAAGNREVVDKTEREAAEARKREEEDRRKHDEEAKRKADEVAKKRFGEEEAKRAAAGRCASRSRPTKRKRRAPRGVPAAVLRVRPPAPPTPRAGAEKQRGRLTVVTALSADEVRERSVASFRRRTQRLKGRPPTSRRKSWSARSRSRRRSPSRNSPTAWPSARST